MQCNAIRAPGLGAPGLWALGSWALGPLDAVRGSAPYIFAGWLQKRDPTEHYKWQQRDVLSEGALQCLGGQT